MGAIAMQAVSVEAGSPRQGRDGDSPGFPLQLARLTLDTAARELTYELSEDIVRGAIDPHVRISGYAPPGWDTAPLVDIVGHRGVWHYAKDDEYNILAGLSYVDVYGRRPELSQRGRIEVLQKAPATFPRVEEVSRVLGTCDRSLTMFGVCDGVKVDIAPAVVAIIRAPAPPGADGCRRVTLAFTARCEGAVVPGVGRVGIDVVPLSGAVQSTQRDADFPARMSMSLRMRYLTPFGVFITGVETYVAERIDEFPPFGVELSPVQSVVPVFSESEDTRVGEQFLGPLVALAHLAADNPPAEIPMRRCRP